MIFLNKRKTVLLIYFSPYPIIYNHNKIDTDNFFDIFGYEIIIKKNFIWKNFKKLGN